ncbi:hypothetical protein ABPG75_003357 [Micractinium tetrahymenae]
MAPSRPEEAPLPLPLSPVLPHSGSSPRLPHAASASSLLPHVGSAGSLLPHQGSGIGVPLLLSHQGSGVPPTTPLARQGSGIPALQHAGSGIPLQHQGSGIPHQGSGVPLLQHQGSQSLEEWAATPSPAAAPSVSRRLTFGPPPPLPPAEAERYGSGAPAARSTATYARTASAAEAGAAAAALAAEGCLARNSSRGREGGQGDSGDEAGGAAPGRRRRRRRPAGPPPPLDQPSPAALLRLLAWVALLWVGYGFQRGLCAAGIPYDCDGATGADAFYTLTLLAFVGGGMGWLAGVARPARFAWLAAPRRAYLWVVYLAVLPAYSGISTLPALRVSLAGMGAWGPVPVVLKTMAFLLIGAALAFHIWLAWRAGGQGSHQADSGSCDGSSAAGTDAAAAGGVTNPRAVASLDTPLSAGGSSTPPSGDRHASASLPGDSNPPGSTPSGSPVKKARSVAGSDVDSAMCDSPSRSSGSEGSPSGSPGASPSKRAAAGAAAAAARAASSRRRQRRGSWRSVGLYLLPRLAVLLYFGAWLAALPASGSYSLHLHHYAMAWAVAIFAAFNHPISGLVLSLATAVFVQGASAYGFDPLFTVVDGDSTGCLTVSSPPSGQMTCAFWSATPFDIGFCSNTSWIPWFDCNVSWPWPETAVANKAQLGRNRTHTFAPKALDLGEVLTNVTAAPLATGGSLAWGVAPVTPAPIPI